jgi:hypothetical protein
VKNVIFKLWIKLYVSSILAIIIVLKFQKMFSKVETRFLQTSNYKILAPDMFNLFFGKLDLLNPENSLKVLTLFRKQQSVSRKASKIVRFWNLRFLRIFYLVWLYLAIRSKKLLNYQCVSLYINLFNILA